MVIRDAVYPIYPCLLFNTMNLLANINNRKINKKEIHKICIYLFIFAMAVRGMYYIGFMDNPFSNFVSPAFDQINFDKGAIGFANGDILARGGAEGYAPLYKYFLGVIYLAFGRNFYAIWAVQFTIGAISSVFMFLITIRFFNKWVGIICSIFYAVYSPNIFYEGNLIRASLTEFFAIVLFYYLVIYKEQTKLKYAILTGTFLSLIIQCRPNTLCLFPFCIYFVYVIILKKAFLMDKIKHLILFIGFFVIIGTPLMVRTIIIHKKFVLYDTSGPQAILIGNTPTYEGVGWNNQNFINNMRNTVNVDSSKEVFGYIQKMFFSSPIDYVKLYGRKIYWFFNNYEYPANVNYYLYQEFSDVLKNPLGSFSLLTSLSLIGIFFTCKNYKKYLLIYFFLIGLILSVIIVYPTSRFRMPVVPFLMIFASYTFYYIFQKIYERKAILSISCVAFVALMIYLLKIPDAYFYKIRPIDFNNMASAYFSNDSKYNLNKMEEYLIKSWNMNSKINLKRTAIYSNLKSEGKEVEFALIKNPASDNLLELYTSLFSRSFADKNYKDATAYAKKAIELDYSNAKAHKFLSHCYLEKKDYVNAINQYKICIMIEPQNGNNYYNLFALFYNYLQDHLKAIKYFQKALDIEPNILKANNSRWNELEKELESIEFKTQQNIKLNNNKIEKLWNKALKAVKLGRFEIAISNCKEILSIDYGDVKVHNCLAYSYAKLENYEDSISEYINILTLNPYSAKSHYNLYELYSKLKKYSVKAMYHLEQSLKIDSGLKNHDELNNKLLKLKYWAENFRQISFN